MYLLTHTHTHTQYVCARLSYGIGTALHPQQGCPTVYLPVLAGRYTIEVNSIRSERAREGIHIHMYEAVCSYICVCVCVRVRV
jgi:hypothetical protein